MTPASEESRELGGSRAMSQVPTPALSEREKSPSVISHITANTREISEGDVDELSTDDEGVRVYGCPLLNHFISKINFT